MSRYALVLSPQHNCLTRTLNYASLDTHMSPLSTFEVAKAIGIHQATLERWLASGKLESPKQLRIGQKVFRDWTKEDVDRARKLKGTQKRGPKSKKQKQK
jgi:predicted DNA-binding transcriptional regulator AlpA